LFCCQQEKEKGDGKKKAVQEVEEGVGGIKTTSSHQIRICSMAPMHTPFDLQIGI